HLRDRLPLLGFGIRRGVEYRAAYAIGVGCHRSILVLCAQRPLLMSMLAYETKPIGRGLETAAAWLLGALWILPLAYALWTAFHPGEFSTRLVLSAPLTLENFVRAWNAAPFARYFANTIMLCAIILAAQLVLCTIAAYAFSRFEFPGSN